MKDYSNNQSLNTTIDRRMCQRIRVVSATIGALNVSVAKLNQVKKKLVLACTFYIITIIIMEFH